MTGAYDSGIRKQQIIHTLPEKIAKNPSTHRHPFACPRKSPTIGPIAGPIDGAAANIVIASPLSELENKSAITPAEFVSGEEPNAPAKKRIRRSVWILRAPAAPALKAVSMA
jgi:hypothetical protein